VGLARRADPDPGVHADWWVLAPGALAVMSIAAAVCALAAWRSAKMGRARRHTAAQPSLVARTTERLGMAPAPAAGARFALEMRKDDARARTGHVLITVGLVVAVAAGALVVRDNLAAVLDRPERYGVMWDLAVDLPDREPATMSIVDDLVADPRIAAASLVSAGELTIATGSGESQVTAIGVAPLSGRISPSVLDGRSAEGPDELLVGPGTMDDLDLAVGDEVVVEGATDASGQTARRTSRVVGAGMLPMSLITEIDDGLVLPLQTFDELGADRLVADIDAHSAVMLEVPDAADAAAIEAELEDAYGDVVWRPSRPSDVSVLDELTSVPPLLAVFAGLLGTLVIVQSLVAGLRRRRGELAILRALGFRSSQAGSVVLWQAGVLAVVGAAIGIPLGLIAGRSVWRAIAEGANVVPVVDVPVAELALLGAAVGLISLGTAAFPAHRATRMRPADALRAE
jgi:ABC-type lipoprotein release transport system permease subunit